MIDSQSLYSGKAQAHFSMAGTSKTPLLGVCVELPPLSGNVSKGYSSRLIKRDVPIVIGIGESYQLLRSNNFASFNIIASIFFNK